jgi:hypothetical protein
LSVTPAERAAVSVWTEDLKRADLPTLLRTAVSALKAHRTALLEAQHKDDDRTFLRSFVDPLIEVLEKRADDLERPAAARGNA